MNITKRRPISPGEILVEEFMEPLRLTQQALADAMGVGRRTVNEICMGRRSITADTALMLARVFGNTPEFWLNTQQRTDIWEALHHEKRAARIIAAHPIEEFKLAA